MEAVFQSMAKMDKVNKGAFSKSQNVKGRKSLSETSGKEKG